MKIAIDAMGGDNAPQATVEGAVQAINEYGIDIILTGDKEQIEISQQQDLLTPLIVVQYLYIVKEIVEKD